MYFGIRTDSPVAELYLYEGETLVAQETWEADRTLAHGILAHIEQFLGAHDQTIHTLQGLFVFRGPGSFTGLRISITVMNTLAYAASLPLVGTLGDDWRQRAVQGLGAGQNDGSVLPFYGAEARITSPKK